jgi:4-amino-4-deoxy-L-arabinose transferase
VKDRFVGKDDFAQWLAEHRQQGRVSLVICCQNATTFRGRICQDSLYIQGRLAYLQYLPK